VCICLTVLVVLGIGVRFALPRLVVAVGNNRLAKHLTCPPKVTAVHLGLLDYRVTIQGLRVKQPDGFDGSLFLDLPEVRFRLAVSSVFSSPLTVDEITVVGATVHLIRDRDGTLNMTRLLHPAGGRSESAWARRPMHIKRIAVRDSILRYTDLALSEEPVDITINQLEAVITDVYREPARSWEHSLLGRAEMTARMIQPGFSDAPLGIIVRFACLDSEQPIPVANAALRLAGLELQPWHALLPQSVSQAVWGDVLDMNVDLAMAAEMLDCVVAIVTPAGDALVMKVGGTPRQPLVSEGSRRGMVGDRALEVGSNALKNAAGAGGELGRTGFSTVAAAGKGAGTLIAGIATGLFKTATSVSHGDMSAAGADLWDTASASATNTVDMVGNTGAKLWTGAMKSGSAAGGGDHAQVWRADTQRRWTASWEQACKSIEQSDGTPHAWRGRPGHDECPPSLP
jgi:hypothetical protein